MKKFLSAVLAVSMLSASFAWQTAMAEQTVETKTVYLNVAENKPVTAGSIHKDFPASNLVDGRQNTFVVPESYVGTDSAGYEDDWFSIDLLRKYPITKIELHDRMNNPSDGGLGYLEVWVSNSADFSDYKPVGKITDRDDSVFAEDGIYTIELDGIENYRYVRLQKTKGAGYYGYSEIKVFSEMTVTQTEISSVSASHWENIGGYEYSPDRAIDGLNVNDNQAWVAETAPVGEYPYLELDLGEQKNIGYMELEDRANNGNTASRQGWLIYGSNSCQPKENIIHKGNLDEYAQYRKLARIGHFGDYLSGEAFPFPLLADGICRLTFDDTNSYQYITLKKDYTPLPAVIGELRAYVINPEIISVITDEKTGKVTVSFTDEMDDSTVNADTVRVTDNEGNLCTVTGQWKDSYTYSFTIDGYNQNKIYSLEISENVKNKKNVGLSETYIENEISAKCFTCAGEKIDFRYLSGTNNVGEATLEAQVNVKNIASVACDAVLVVATYDELGRLKYIKSEKKNIASGNTENIKICENVPYELSDTAKMFVLDSELKPVGESKNASVIELSDVYVSKSGNDNNDGRSEETAVLTIRKAQEIVRSINSSMDDDINVYIGDGVYTQPETLVFTDLDSGTNGYNVNYIGSDNTVISGGELVDNWTSEGDGLYSAEVSADMIRELYVNGKAAVRAQSESKIKPVSIYEEDGVKKGVVVSSKDLGVCENPEDIQLHYTRSWKSIVLNAEDIVSDGTNTTIIMKQPEFNYAATPYGEGESLWIDETNSFYVENAFELLDSENEFYYDKAAGKLYYKTNSVVMSEAEVYIPRLEQLVSVKGTDLSHKAENISFRNITFAHCAYKDADNGFLANQAQDYINIVPSETSYPLDNTMVGANIRISAAENISFKDNVFHGLGAVGLGMYDGAVNCFVEGNVFYDINDSAITVGLPTDAYMQKQIDGQNEVALFKKTTASDQAKYYNAAYANDGKDNTGWSLVKSENGSHLDGFWQVDLEKPYTISKIELSGRRDYNEQDVARRNFEILGSNDENFNTYSVLATYGGEAYDNISGYETEVTDSNKYRYVRLRKTVDEYFFISDIRIYTPDEAPLIQEVCKNNLIKNNYITRIGQYNWGAPAIQTYYTEALEISHNTIKDVPYSGIAMGWGWESTTDSVTSNNNKIKNNYIDTYNMRMFDGGGIYTLGPQPESIISGNFITGQVNGHGGFYPDSGSADYEFSGNVIEDSDMPMFIYGPQKNLTVSGNYTNSNNTVYNNKGEDCSVETPVFYIPKSESTEVAAIKSNAGIESGYEALLGVPYEKSVVTTDIVYNFGNAIDENKWNIGALQDPKFLEFYLEYLIDYAEDLYDDGGMFAFLNEKYRTLYSAISTAKSAYNTAKGEITYATYDAETKTYAPDEGMTMNRKAVIEARIALKAAIEKFLNS